jgi:dolichol-phosphate mannosyltransferase
MELTLVVPCYNEIDNVPKLREEFFPVVDRLAESRSVEVIFVDDGSRDGTLAALQAAFGTISRPNMQVKFLKHPVNRGLGAAIRTGLSASLGDVVVTTDSDGTYRHDEIFKLIQRMTPEVDLVTASPYHPEGGVENVPGYRLVLSKGSSILYRILVSWKIHTYTALFRAYRRRVVETVPFQSDGFLAGTEILVNSLLMGYGVAEYPTVLHARVKGVSKARILQTIRAHLRFQWQILLWRLHFSRPSVTIAGKKENSGYAASSRRGE